MLATAGIAAAHPALRAQDAAPAREIYEFRLYHLRTHKRGAAHEYFRSALVPALGRAGLGPIGVFDVSIGETPSVYMLIPHKSAETVVSLPSRLLADAEYAKAGAAFLDAPANDPAFERVESSLMLAFEKMPKMEPPGTDKPRIFELRRYEQPGERASLKKIQMFNDGGELSIFRRVGFRPVFFGQTIVGARMPNLQYMITFENFAARDKLWAAFRTDSEWKKLSAMKEYSDPQIMSHIGGTVLSPAGYSQI